MRFETKFDAWIVALVAVGLVASCTVPLVLFDIHAPGGILLFWPIPFWLIVLSFTLPQYYEVRDEGLFIRQGWRKILLPYISLAEIQMMSDSRSSAVYSTDRILIVTDLGKRFVIAVNEKERFLAEVSRRSPQLVPRTTGLAVPLSPPTIL